MSEKQLNIATGLMMGDGNIDSYKGRTPKLRVNMISPNYLKYIDSEFGIFGNNVSMTRTAEENAKHCRDTGFVTNAKKENFSDVYRWTSMAHPDLLELSTWYKSGKKVWPQDIELNPTILTHWYCGDGSLDTFGGNQSISIAISNEGENTDKIDKMFQNVGLPSPNNYKYWEREDGSIKCDAVFTKPQTNELLEYMNGPLPDFNYKFL
jgi:hypothetical protein